jgi:DNA modification methylase
VSDLKIIQGDCRERLRELPAASVHCCVTSPPYFGLRDYGTAQWDGGDERCDHKEITARRDAGRVNVGAFNGPTRGGVFYYRNECAKCGARRVDSQIGLEPSPAEYVAQLVEVFREVRRVLRDDGTLWLNLGDSYGSGEIGRHDALKPAKESSAGITYKKFEGSQRQQRPRSSIKPKDLIGIPWRVAFALQEDGWWLRQDIIWAKPNPMPESVEDRCTKAHEYIFLLSKSERYYFDGEAIKEPAKVAWDSRDMIDLPGANTKDAAAVAQGLRTRGGNSYHPPGLRYTANRRSVWTVTTSPYPEAHFATYPPALIRPCVLAGAPVGGVVLDPFAGSGTTGKVALEQGRSAILIELNAAYVKLIKKRCVVNLPLPFERAKGVAA